MRYLLAFGALSFWMLPALADNTPTAVSAQLPPAAEAEATASCLQLHEQMAVCAEHFTPLMIELRAKYEPSFAAMLQRKGMRAKILAAGIAETRQDGSGPKEPRVQRCAGWVRSGPRIPEDESVRMSACWALDTCEKKAACARPMLEQRLSARAREGKWQDASHLPKK